MRVDLPRTKAEILGIQERIFRVQKNGPSEYKIMNPAYANGSRYPLHNLPGRVNFHDFRTFRVHA